MFSWLHMGKDSALALHVKTEPVRFIHRVNTGVFSQGVNKAFQVVLATTPLISFDCD
jgi:hypothetical protein